MPKRSDDEFDKEKLWDLAIKILTLIAAVVVWVMSVQFSAAGFGMISGSEFSWMGYPIAIFVVTIPEILFNNGYHTANKTMALTAILAYAWGILSNIMGLWTTFGSVDPRADALRGIGTIVLAIILGTIIEIAPQAMLNVALGLEGDGRDFVSQMILQVNGTTFPANPWKPKARRPMGFNTSVTPESSERPAATRNTMSNMCPVCGNENMAIHNGRADCPGCGYRGVALL